MVVGRTVPLTVSVTVSAYSSIYSRITSREPWKNLTKFDTGKMTKFSRGIPVAVTLGQK